MDPKFTLTDRGTLVGHWELTSHFSITQRGQHPGRVPHIPSRCLVVPSQSITTVMSNFLEEAVQAGKFRVADIHIGHPS